MAADLPLLVGQAAGGTSYSVPIQTLLFFTALSFLPAVLLLMTGFTRIVIVLSLLRQALGTQAAPPNQVVVVNEKFGIRLTDIVTPSERMRRLSRAA